MFEKKIKMRNMMSSKKNEKINCGGKKKKREE